MTDILFYQLLDKRLDEVLPDLLEKCVARKWRAVVHGGSEERMEALNNALWTYRDDSFLPHGTATDGNAEAQPVFLTADGNNPNKAIVRFLVDGATIDDAAAYERVVYIFDGNDPDALASARNRWKIEKAAGHAITYWAQDETGHWVKKA
ncbi:MAG: DNA polymerase III subunit chi [Rhizobiales bacterium]|nr:DNA polymerase III subunit chi [Hyphomicrobiales bacterium]